MPSSQSEDRQQLRVVQSHLGESLLRLQHRIDQDRKQKAYVETLFAAWQRNWSSGRDQISQHLERIELQIDELTNQTPAAPRLSIVRAPVDDAWQTMAPY